MYLKIPSFYEYHILSPEDSFLIRIDIVVDKLDIIDGIVGTIWRAIVDSWQSWDFTLYLYECSVELILLSQAELTDEVHR